MEFQRHSFDLEQEESEKLNEEDEPSDHLSDLERPLEAMRFDSFHYKFYYIYFNFLFKHGMLSNYQFRNSHRIQTD